MPRFLSDEHQLGFAQKLGQYLRSASIKRAVVVFHGGEPLLIGADAIVAYASKLRAAVGPDIQLDIGIQTNGLLLSHNVLDLFESASIDVSLSLDGPREANDLHRTTRKGRSSFDKVMAGLDLLKNKPQVFAGVISVIDTRTSPLELFEFFTQQNVPKLDFLLPDANHLRQPPGRSTSPSLYQDWLIQAFDTWLDHYPSLAIRTFESILDSVSGLPSKTDAFGYGDVSLITIETNGTYHDLDVLKITHEGASRLEGTVLDTPINVVANSEQLKTHRAMLKKDGLCAKCRECQVVDICGGGSVPHRYGENGFNNPTVYCHEMFTLITHVQHRLEGLLNDPPSPVESINFDFEGFERAELAHETLGRLCHNSSLEYVSGFATVLEHIANQKSPYSELALSLLNGPNEVIQKLACWPGSIAWTRAYKERINGRSVLAVDGKEIFAQEEYLSYLVANQLNTGEGLLVGVADEWLRSPFGNAITFPIGYDQREVEAVVQNALTIISDWRPALYAEINAACRTIQFVEDPTADPEKIISFSDDSVPGALYVSVTQGRALIDAYDLADSIIHEHRHQKLYLLERLSQTVQPYYHKVPSPWREELRPPSGVMHAVFVFIELRRFWMHILNNGPDRLFSRAKNQVSITNERLLTAFSILKKCPLSGTGVALLESLERAFYSEA